MNSAFSKWSITFSGLLLLALVPKTFANMPPSSSTIESSSINWEDEKAKLNLLRTVPRWDQEKIQMNFEFYKHPEKSQLPQLKDEAKYNIQFIHAWFGPIENPFKKIVRPTKAFIFVNSSLSSQEEQKGATVYVAPLIGSTLDGNYYVFAKEEAQPITLNDWVDHIRAKTPDKSLRFNVCNGYGNVGNDDCNQTSYQQEMNYLYATKLYEKNENINRTVSAKRKPSEDWQLTLKQALTARADADNIYDTSAAWNDLNNRNKLLNTVTTWNNYASIYGNFEKIRDLRYFVDEQVPGFLRRLTWLYPDDGCWTRAAAVIKDFFGPFNNANNYFLRPSKVFAFGNLCVNTTNAKEGYVTWWYHTAPVIRDNETNQTYVLDPSVNPNHPMAIEEWMKTISSNTGACAGFASKIERFNICNGYGVSPFDSCQNANKVNFATEASTVLDQASFRIDERARQHSLGRDANKVLGDTPPWQDAQ